jgi:hypothetical protein
MMTKLLSDSTTNLPDSSRMPVNKFKDQWQNRKQHCRYRKNVNYILLHSPPPAHTTIPSYYSSAQLV